MGWMLQEGFQSGRACEGCIFLETLVLGSPDFDGCTKRAMHWHESWWCKILWKLAELYLWIVLISSFSLHFSVIDIGRSLRKRRNSTDRCLMPNQHCYDVFACDPFTIEDKYDGQRRSILKWLPACNDYFFCMCPESFIHTHWLPPGQRSWDINVVS